MRSITRGELKTGMVVAMLAATIPVSVCLAGDTATRVLSVRGDVISESGPGRLCVPVPECGHIEGVFECDGKPLEANLVETAYIRDQKIALFEFVEPPAASSRVDISLKFQHTRGEVCVDAGPLTRLCGRTIIGYDVAPSLDLTSGPGTITRCQNLIECRDVQPDILLIGGHAVWESPYLDSLAGLWAQRMGLNAALIDVASISAYSPVDIRDFIDDLYDLACAEHFGDGHLGFVVLVGDAYEDDNVTSMIPEYDGYGLKAEASDHFYACISGDDDFEDLMIGRIPVGNEQELINYYLKLASYSPLPPEDWTKTLLFAGGTFFTSRDDYVVYFDSMAAYVPEDYAVPRYYRHDFPFNSAGDTEAIQAMKDSINAGKLFLLYSGDGDMWSWGPRYERVFRSADIAGLSNTGKLPIVLSISCSNGWFDNITETYTDGGVDCFAERMVLEEDAGAIACLASSRDADGSASTTITPEIVKAAFVNGSTFLGELMLEAKTRHLIHLGKVVFVRQFNLFGDPCLNFVLNELPNAAPDLVMRPYDAEISPEFPTPGDRIDISAEVWNASGVPIDEFDVTVYSGHPDSGGVIVESEILTLTDFYAWERRSVHFSFTAEDAGDLDIFLVADGFGNVIEMDETNNIVELASYVYPCEAGFPVKIDDDIEGQVIADLNGDGKPDILVSSGGTQARAIEFDGTTLWRISNMGLPQWFGGVAPSAFDLNGDGTTEAILTTRSGVSVVEGATGEEIWTRYTDYPVLSPIVTDLDADGSFEVLMGTFSFSFSSIHAFDAAGSYRWLYSVPGYGKKLVGMITCDIEHDGSQEIVFATDAGDLTCLTSSVDPPGIMWEKSICGTGLFCLAAGDLERDGAIELIAACQDSVYIINVLDGETETAVACPCTPTSISLGDLDGDRSLEIVCTSECGRILEIDNGAIVLDLDTGQTAGCASLADVDQDGIVEIIFASEEGTVRVFNPVSGDVIPPVPMRGLCLSGPGVQDIDGDGNIEIVAGSSDSLLFILDLGTQGGRIEWFCQGCTGTRTGLYAQPLFGTISEEQTLSGRIDVVGDIIVETGGALILHRGTDVRLVHDDVYPVGSSPGNCEIIVSGSIVATGSQSTQITFRPISIPCGNDEWAGIRIDSSGSATISHVSVTGAVTGIECGTSSAYISECTISNCMLGIKTDGFAPTLDHNTIIGNNYGISANGSDAIIVGNLIKSNLYNGIILSNGSSAVLSNNKVSYTIQGHGVSCYSSAPTFLGGGRYEFNALAGIYLSSSSPSIDSCFIGYNGDCGIKAAYYSDPVISNTSLVGNNIGVGVYIYAHPVLGDTIAGLGGFNDIRQNTQYAVYNKTQNEIMAQRNWWGTVNPDPGAFWGPIDFSGWLDMSPAGIGGVPDHLALIQSVYPNPFTSSVNVHLAVGEHQLPVDVGIYDVRGRLVRRMPTVMTSGEKRLGWDGTDTYDRPVSSGTYFVQIRSRTQTDTRKVMLLR
ncbi:MAG: C25 family cysteine peptidase [Candidatus Eisenbacteria bacterium]